MDGQSNTFYEWKNPLNIGKNEFFPQFFRCFPTLVHTLYASDARVSLHISQLLWFRKKQWDVVDGHGGKPSLHGQKTFKTWLSRDWEKLIFPTVFPLFSHSFSHVRQHGIVLEYSETKR